MNRTVNNFLAVGGIALFVFFVFKIGQKSYHLNVYGATAEGKIDSIYLNWKNDKKVKCFFEVDGLQYEGGAWYDDNVRPKVGDVFPVQYSTRHPSINKMIFD